MAEREPELARAVSLLAHDVPPLVKAEIDLAKLEARETAREVGTRAGLISASGYATAVGVFFLGAGVALLVSESVGRRWAGPIVVGAALLLLAAIAVPVAFRRSRRAPG